MSIYQVKYQMPVGQSVMTLQAENEQAAKAALLQAAKQQNISVVKVLSIELDKYETAKSTLIAKYKKELASFYEVGDNYGTALYDKAQLNSIKGILGEIFGFDAKELSDIAKAIKSECKK